MPWTELEGMGWRGEHAPWPALTLLQTLLMAVTTEKSARMAHPAHPGEILRELYLEPMDVKITTAHWRHIPHSLGYSMPPPASHRRHDFPITTGILVMHHSWHKKGLLRISKASRGALAQLLDEEDIRLVLTGHVHTPAVKAFQPIPGGPTLYECRCGTTTQIDKMSYDAKSILGLFPARPDWPPNSLLLHRLYELADGTLQWEVETRVRTRKGFTKVSSTQRIPL